MPQPVSGQMRAALLVPGRWVGTCRRMARGGEDDFGLGVFRQALKIGGIGLGLGRGEASEEVGEVGGGSRQ